MSVSPEIKSTQPPPYPAPVSQAPMPMGPPMGYPAGPVNNANMNNQQQVSNNITIVNQQPVADEGRKLVLGSIYGHREWTTDLFACCEDCGSACYAMCCPTCLLYSIAARMGENICVADCIPGGTVLLRTRLRTLGGIRSNYTEDQTTTYFLARVKAAMFDQTFDDKSKRVA